MKKIFIGLLFVFCDLSLLGIGFMPAFVGYILILLGVGEEYECPSLNGTRAILTASAIIGLVLWVAGLFGYGMTFPVGSFLRLLCTYRLVVWAEEQAEEQGWDSAQTGRFRTSWYALAGASAAAVILSRFSAGMALTWAVVALAAAVWYIYSYYKLWKTALPYDPEDDQ